MEKGARDDGCGPSDLARESRDPGQSISWGDRDYLIPVAILVLNGSQARPQRGDRIADPNVPDPVSGVAGVYEVITPVGNQAWEWCDKVTQTIYRVHTKRVA